MKNIISTFSQRPKTRLAWQAMWLGIACLFVPLFLGTFAAVIRPMIDKISSEGVGIAFGFGAGIFSLVLSLFALVTGIRAFKSGERSWVLWIGFVPALLIALFWIAMIVGEFIYPH